MSEENQIDEMKTPKYFYRLRNCDEQHPFHQSEKGTQWPFCKKDVNNILIHLQKNESCADKIDINQFEIMYKATNAEDRRIYLTAKKQKERQKKRRDNEPAYRKEMNDEKKRERESKRQKDEDAFRKQIVGEKRREKKQRRRERSECIQTKKSY